MAIAETSGGGINNRKRRGVSTAERWEWLLFLLLVTPNLFLFSVFTYWPLIYNTYLSFMRWDFLGPQIWVGLDNYEHLFTSASFGTILWNTFVFTFASVVLLFGLGLGIAILLNQPLRGRNAARAIVFSQTVCARTRTPSLHVISCQIGNWFSCQKITHIP